MARINVISGPNASGKTSLLEAVYLLGMGRSFRSAKAAPLIAHARDSAFVYGEVLGDTNGEIKTIGLRRSRHGHQEIRLNRQAVKSLSDLAREFPVQLLDANSFSLVLDGPKTRRQFMDWGVFHVKPAFMPAWRQARKAIAHRNELIRGGGARVPEAMEMEAWEQELDRAGTDMDAMRQDYMSGLGPYLERMLGNFPGFPRVEVSYRRGWRLDTSLREELRCFRDKDRAMGYTQVGPHRATVELRVDGRPVAEVLSRGQQKLLVACMKLAQSALLADEAGPRGIFLVDDLPAELDSTHRKILCRVLDGLGVQVFITCVDADEVFGAPGEGAWLNGHEVQRFHVEQGEYKCLMN